MGKFWLSEVRAYPIFCGHKKGRSQSLFETALFILCANVTVILNNHSELFQHFTFFVEKHNAFGSDGINQSYFISLYAIFCHFYGCFLNGEFSIVFLDGVLNRLQAVLSHQSGLNSFTIATISTSDAMLLANATELPNPITSATANNTFFIMLIIKLLNILSSYAKE